MGIWDKLFGKKEVVSKPDTTPNDSLSSLFPIQGLVARGELKERREWLFFAILTYLRNDAFKKFKKEFSIDDVTFESKYDFIYSEMMIALLTSGLVNIKEKMSEDDFHGIIVDFIYLILAFGMKLNTKELMDEDKITDIFTIYVSVMENYNEFIDLFVERTNKILSLDQEKFKHFSTLNLIGMGLAYGADAFHSVRFDDILKDNREMRQHLLKSGDFGKNLVNFLNEIKK